ncbi:sensor histidine kinase [Psychromarinibacter halotolerans]|uniref:histidine kinase n=1 Tax=Psychromarinibacter halotolerans TaxID=1775175 RepID=A0ABV7GS74_9RHOB|nr:sensor histidine kinase [Psychromarinibacter halotolerans]MDF0597604.1 sensor histidine kinase N-terminal domain-containing protein [Psychromarinibacter halotolerans]
MADRTARSLLSRLLTGAILILAFGGVIVALSTWFNGLSAAREAYDRLLLGAANDIAESIRFTDGTPMVALPTSAFELLAQAPDDRVSYAVRGPDGAIITGLPDTPLTERARSDGPIFFDGAMQGEDARYVDVVRRFAERDFSGIVRVTVGQTMIARRALAVELMLDALVPMLIAGAALIILSVIVVRGAVRPLGRIAEGLSRRDPYDLTPVPTADVPREIGAILTAMNGFMGRLDRQFGAMQSLISDTAHQLRTPVAAIRVQAETAIEEPDATERKRLLERLARRTRSLGTLLDQMLSRALVIHRTDSVSRELIDLRQIALEIVETRDHEVLVPDVEVELVIGDAPVTVAGDEFSLVQAGKNLLTNALKHGAPPVRIGVSEDGGRARLWIEDAGDGLSDDVLSRFSERFKRSTGSREDSVGLGLSIVAAVADAFAGRIVVSNEGDRFRIALDLPAAPEAET